MPRKRARKPSAYKRTPEGHVLHAVLDLLLAKRILAFRMNTGVARYSHNGRERLVKYGHVGMADILAFPRYLENALQFDASPRTASLAIPSLHDDFVASVPPQRITRVQRKSDYPFPLWLEIKSESGQQTPAQLAFQKIVESEGHSYVLVNNIDVLIQWLKEKGL